MDDGVPLHPRYGLPRLPYAMDSRRVAPHHVTTQGPVRAAVASRSTVRLVPRSVGTERGRQPGYAHLSSPETVGAVSHIRVAV